MEVIPEKTPYSIENVGANSAEICCYANRELFRRRRYSSLLRRKLWFKMNSMYYN